MITVFKVSVDTLKNKSIMPAKSLQAEGIINPPGFLWDKATIQGGREPRGSLLGIPLACE